MAFRIAVVQPLTVPPPNDESNVQIALEHIEAAARGGADFIAFPETYPGPWRMPATFDPTPSMVAAAARLGIYVQYGTIEPLNQGSAYNVLMLANPDGNVPGCYRRTHPPGPWIYTGGEYWEFDYIPASEYPVFETAHGVVGLAMCSEAYMPEVTRALALRGAELIFMPAGIPKRRLRDTWRTVIWARAIENLAVVVTTQNIFVPTERGLAMVAEPEGIGLESTRPGTYFVDVDLCRARELRNGIDGVTSSHTDATKAGLLTQWQRPELYGHFYPPTPALGRDRSGGER